jgi:CheY-like chemotaxis protein
MALTREQSAELFEALAPAAAGTNPDQRFELAIARAQAARLDARLELASSDAHATTIVLRLARADTSTRAAQPQRRSVLYIEDNEVNMMIVRELLAQRADIDFHGAGDGRGGIELARSLQPDLVLVDMQLPDFDGLEVLRRLRAETATASLRCVALSANAMVEDVRRAREAGFDDYWTKPIDLAAFLLEIDRLADRLRPA